MFIFEENEKQTILEQTKEKQVHYAFINYAL